MKAEQYEIFLTKIKHGGQPQICGVGLTKEQISLIKKEIELVKLSYDKYFYETISTRLIPNEF